MRFLIITAAILLFSCKAQESPTKTENTTKADTSKEKEIFFNVVKEATNSGYKEAGNIVMYRQNGFVMIWDSIFSNYMNNPPIPEIDFETKQLILVTMGEKPNGGYSIKIESVIETKKEITITIIESKPGNTCMTASVISYPFQIIEIPKTNKKIIYNRNEKIYDCEK